MWVWKTKIFKSVAKPATTFGLETVQTTQNQEINSKWISSKGLGVHNKLSETVRYVTSTYEKQLLFLLLFIRPLPRDGGMVEDHGAPEARQLPRVWTSGRTETESHRRVSGAKSL